MKETKERVYTYWKIMEGIIPLGSTMGSTNRKCSIKESDLKPKHIDLFLGELIKTWNNSPAKVQHKFLMRFLKKLPRPI